MFANLSNFFRFSNLLFHSNDYVHLVARYAGYILFRFSNLLFHSNDYVHLVARYAGYILCGVDSVTFPSMGATGGQYVENTPEISKNQGFANFKFLFYRSNPLFS